jgi:hypothetical protein
LEGSFPAGNNSCPNEQKGFMQHIPVNIAILTVRKAFVLTIPVILKSIFFRIIHLALPVGKDLFPGVGK